MAIRVLMRRPVSAEHEQQLRRLTDRLRVLAMDQEGYLSGETLKRVEPPGVILVISKWKSRAAWERWLASPERAAVQAEIDALLGAPTEYEIYDYD